MHKVFKIFLGFIVSCSLLGCSKVKMEQISNDAVIMAFGDSLTFGYGAQKNESYPAKLSEMIGKKVINEGINGNTTQDGLNRISSAIEEHKPQLIIIGLGGNDMLRGVSPDIIKENLRKLIIISKDSGAQVILLAEPQPSGIALIAGLSDAKIYEEVAKETNTILLSKVYSKWLSKQEFKSDLIHLNAQGYENVAKDISEFLKSTGAIEK